MIIADCYDALARMIDYPVEKQNLQTDYNIVSTYMADHELDCSLSSFADFTTASSLAALQEEYVATFDFNPATAPYLGHHLYGDNQKKAGYMIMLKQEFGSHDYTFSDTELPDHLSVVLGFLAHLARQTDSGTRQPFIAACILPGVERMVSAFSERQDCFWKELIEAARLLCAADCKEVQSC